MKYLNKLKTWIPVINHERSYQIFSDGRVKSLDKLVNGNHGIKNKKGKVCKPFMRNGYMSVALSEKNIIKQYTIHRLLAIHFIPNPYNKKTVNHKDGNKLNNRLSNLEWSTHSEQQIHSIKTGLRKPMESPMTGRLGKDHNRSKAVLQYSLDMVLIKEYGSTCEAQRFGFIQTAVSKCCRGELKTHKGFIWKYKQTQLVQSSQPLNPQQ